MRGELEFKSFFNFPLFLGKLKKDLDSEVIEQIFSSIAYDTDFVVGINDGCMITLKGNTDVNFSNFNIIDVDVKFLWCLVLLEGIVEVFFHTISKLVLLIHYSRYVG